MGKLIAVVEDEPFIAEVLEFLLAGVDRQVKLLRSGEEARRFFSHSQLTGEDTPALVVLDLMMPDDDGEAIYESMLKPGSGWIAGRPKQLFSQRLGKRRSKRGCWHWVSINLSPSPFPTRSCLPKWIASVVKSNPISAVSERVWDRRRAISAIAVILCLMMLTPVIFIQAGSGIRLLWFFNLVWAIGIALTWLGARFVDRPSE